jgi:hypothetical protein
LGITTIFVILIFESFNSAEKRHALFALILYAILLSFYVLYRVIFPLYLTPAVSGYTNFWQLIVPYSGSVLITIGWMTTSEFNIRNARKQHTINFLTEVLRGQTRMDDLTIIKSFLPTLKDVICNDIAQIAPLPIAIRPIPTLPPFKFGDDAHLLCRSLDRELNLFEFMAIGIFQKDFDEVILKRSLRSFVITFCNQCDPYVVFSRDGGKEPWSNLSILANNWRRNPNPQ